MNEVRHSAQDYLEAILMLQGKHGFVRSVDVAEHLNYSKASVSVAVKHLREDGHVVVDDKGVLCLTETGEHIARQVYERHIVLSHWFEKIGVPHEVALADACQIEHNISETTFSKMKEFLGAEFVEEALEKARKAKSL